LPEKKLGALKRRIAPSTPLSLDLDREGSSGKLRLDFKLCFDMNAGAAIQEKTGLLLTDVGIWAHIGEPKAMGAIFWAALLANHPDYNSDEGLEVARSYIQESNAGEIVDALWAAYLAFLPAEKREFVLRLKADLEDKEKREKEPPLEQAPAETPAAASSGGSSSGPSPATISASASTSSAS
jgi:hypothetical protein